MILHFVVVNSYASIRHQAIPCTLNLLVPVRYHDSTAVMEGTHFSDDYNATIWTRTYLDFGNIESVSNVSWQDPRLKSNYINLFYTLNSDFSIFSCPWLTYVLRNMCTSCRFDLVTKSWHTWCTCYVISRSIMGTKHLTNYYFTGLCEGNLPLIHGCIPLTKGQ